jgi:Ribbon-helix-helix protein, copG family
MPITRPVRPKTTESFVSGAPDTQPKRLRPKQQITLTICPDLLAKVDEMAEKMGESRAALINLAIYRTVEGGL